jgi:hypothetical protein
MGSLSGAAPAGGGGDPGTTIGTFLQSGGQVAWVSGLTFIVSAAVYWILGTQYQSAQTELTLSDGDATNPRFDTIALTTSSTAVAIEGTPAADPSPPVVDPSTQLSLTVVLIEADATEPGNLISNVTIYAENAGSPGEWTTSSNGSGWTLDSTTDPHAGSKHITGLNITGATSYVQFQKPSSTIDITQYERLLFYLRVTAAWNSNRWLQVLWLFNGVQVGTVVDVAEPAFGFDKDNTSVYQVIIIPTLLFNVLPTDAVNQLRIRRNNSGGISFRLDDVALQFASTGQQDITGITQAQADARYQQLPSFDTHFYSVPFVRR